jgi:hypothetical protein
MNRRRQRAIRPDQWTDPGLLRAPKDARLTGIGLWGIVDDEGRIELRADLIAGSIYPGDPSMTPEVIETHLLELDDAGFLTLYQVAGRSWVQLVSPLATQRPHPSTAPPPPSPSHPEVSGKFMAVGSVGDSVWERGWRERARERIEGEGAERATQWAEWESAQENDPRPPARPLLLDAPPIGCPEHPNGRFADCGPCGTARRRHDKWVAQQRYAEHMARYENEADE